MCQIQSALSNQFEEWYWGHLGHGIYCINSNGLAYSHSDANLNVRKTPIKYSVRDVLNFNYHPEKGILAVNKNNGESFEMKVETGVGHCYAICVYLFYGGDSVEIIDS